MRLAPLVLLLALAACGRAAGDPVTVTAEERRQLDILTIDGFVELVRVERDAQGRLVAHTRQGDVLARYLIAAAPGQALGIHRIDDRVRLLVADDGIAGTGPAERR